MRRTLLVLLLVAGCWSSGPDPELTRRRAALDAWRRAETALGQGRPGEARNAIDDALEARPGDPVLRMWRARAEAADGDLATAIATLESLVDGRSDAGLARYNLAAYLCRMDRVVEAAPHLRAALRAGVASPREVLDDADFARHLDHPALGFLPSAPVEATLSGPEGAVFRGSTGNIDLRVIGLDLEALQVDAPTVRGPVDLEQVVAKRTHVEDGEDVVEVTWSLRSTGAGTASVGPVTVQVGERVARAGPVTFESLAPPGAEPPAPGAVRLQLPTQRGAAGAPGPGPITWREAKTLLARVPPDARVRVEGVEVAPVPWKRFDGRSLVWTLWTWSRAPDTARVTLRAGGRTIHEGPVPERR